MINRSPWLWGARRTASGLTARTSLGVHILQGKRAPGMSNVSPQVLQAQNAGRQSTRIFQQAGSAIRKGFLQTGLGRSAYQLFFRFMYANAYDLSSLPDATLIQDQVQVSKGVMTPTTFGTIVADVSLGTITLAYSPLAFDDTQNLLDKPVAVAYDPTDDKWLPLADVSNVRSSGVASFSTPLGWLVAGHTIVIYLFFAADPTQLNANTSSNSLNSTTVVVA